MGIAICLLVFLVQSQCPRYCGLAAHYRFVRGLRRPYLIGAIFVVLALVLGEFGLTVLALSQLGLGYF